MTRRSPFGLVVAVVVCLLVLASIVGAMFLLHGQTSNVDAESMNATAVEYAIHKEVNERRAANGRDTLEFDPQLRTVSRYHSRQMGTGGFFGHTGPDGQTFEDRYERFDYYCKVNLNSNHYLTGGENLVQTHYGVKVESPRGIGSTTYTTLDALAEGVVDQWMNSPSHRDNLLSPHWAVEGVGVFVDSQDAVYVTQNFC